MKIIDFVFFFFIAISICDSGRGRDNFFLYYNMYVIRIVYPTYNVLLCFFALNRFVKNNRKFKNYNIIRNIMTSSIVTASRVTVARINVDVQCEIIFIILPIEFLNKCVYVGVYVCVCESFIRTKRNDFLI